MKKIAFAIAVILSIASAARAQTQPPQPGPEHKKMLIWVGDWTLVEETRESVSAPWDKAAVSCETQPILGGFFLEYRCKIKAKGREINHVEIESYDPVKKTNVTSFFNSEGVSGHVTFANYVGNKEEIRYTLLDINGKMLEARCTWTFGPDFMSMSGSCDQLTNGKWELFRKMTGTKTKAAVK